MRKVRTAILISGRGSNMLALANAAKSKTYPAQIVMVGSNIPEAPGLQRAADMGIPIVATDHLAFDSRESFDRHMHSELIKYEPEIICCAGFMRILSPWFVAKWRGSILNIHPSLLPKYKGLNTHKRAIEAGDEYHGCSVHFVNEVLDGGDVILQGKVKVLATDTVDILTQKVLRLEHPTYVKALKSVAMDITQRKNNEPFIRN